MTFNFENKRVVESSHVSLSRKIKYWRLHVKYAYENYYSCLLITKNTDYLGSRISQCVKVTITSVWCKTKQESIQTPCNHAKSRMRIQSLWTVLNNWLLLKPRFGLLQCRGRFFNILHLFQRVEFMGYILLCRYSKIYHDHPIQWKT